MEKVMKFTDALPSDLGHVAGQGLDAIGAFFDTRTKVKLTEREFTRSYAFAKVGSTALTASIRFLAMVNNQQQIALQQARAESIAAIVAKRAKA